MNSPNNLTPRSKAITLPCLVLLDLGNVLISLRSLTEALGLEREGAATDRVTSANTAAGRSMPVDAAALVAALRGSEIFDRFERGRASTAEFLLGLRAFLPAWLSTSLSDDDLKRGYVGILGEEVEGMGLLVEDLKKSGVRVAGLTDTSPLHLPLLDNYPVVRALETVIASCVTGLKKPEPETFRGALARLRVASGDVFYTDDVLANVEGARKIGIRAEVFHGPGHLRELLDLGPHQGGTLPDATGDRTMTRPGSRPW